MPSAENGTAPSPTWQDTFHFPEPLHEAALYGLAGDVVRTTAPHNEGHPAAICAQFLAAFGSAVGSRPYYPVGAARHHANLYIGIVGDTGTGRKGTSLADAVAPVAAADPAWAAEGRTYGLSTGEGLIHHVRDATVNAKGETVDEGARDKRLFAVETEFARVLRAGGRDGSTLSMVLRQGWDAQTLQTLTKTNAERASGAHVSLVAHTTRADLRRHLDDVDVLNGFANRFAWVAAKRERILPDGGDMPPEDSERLAQATFKALDAARTVDRMSRDYPAKQLWREIYNKLTTGRPGGAFGAVTSRGDAQVLRLSVVYALTDGTAVIGEDHLRAAIALWEYCERSALWVFGWSTGDRRADLVLSELRAVYPNGLARDAIRQLLAKNHATSEVLAVLAEQKLAEKGAMDRTGRPGRPVEGWRALPHPPAVGITSFLSNSRYAQRRKRETTNY